MSTPVTLLQELIRNKCVNRGTSDSGGEIRSVATLRKFFDSYKIKYEVFEPKPGRASILARIPGSTSMAPSLMYMGHLDVVPASAEDWSQDPYSGDERGGFVWGRGAVDMLGMTAAMAHAFAELSIAEKKPQGDLLFLAVADEEASGRLGARWLVENHWEKVKTDYMITEGGGYFFLGKPAPAIAVTRGEKGIGWTRLSTAGRSGHGSLPYLADNAALTVSEAVSKLTNQRGHVFITREYREIIRDLGLGWLTGFLLQQPLLLDFALERLARTQAGLAKHLHAISRMTLSPNVVRAGDKINTIPDHGTIECDIRILPDDTIEDVTRAIEFALGKLRDRFSIEVIDYFPSNISPVETPLYHSIVEIATSVHPNARCVPNIFSGVTDARFWRMRGTVVYGFALYDETMTLDEYSRLLHGKDERISTASLELTCEFFRKLPEIFHAKAALVGARRK